MSFFRLFIVGFFLSCCYPAFAGVPDKIEYSEAWVDSLYMKAWEVRLIIPDSAIYYTDLQQDISERIDYTLGVINAHYVKGIAYIYNSYFDVAADEFYKALSLIRETREPEFLKKKALLLQGLGRCYELTYRYDTAKQLCQEGTESAKFADCEICMADLTYNIGVCYRELGDITEALVHFKAALGMYNKLQSQRHVAQSLNNIGLLYHRERRYSLARDSYERALSTVKENEIWTSEISWYINNIGETYFVQDQYDEAEKYYAEALKIAQEFDDKEKIKLFTNNLGDVYLKQNNYPKAIAYYQKCIALGDEEKIDEEMKRAYKQLAEAYKKMGRYEEAWIYNEKFLAQTTSLQETKYTLIGQNAEHRIKEVEREHQLSKEIAKTTRRKLMSATLALGFSLLVLLYVLKSNKVD